MILEVLQHINQNTTSIQMLAPIFEPVAWLIPSLARFCCDLFFGASKGHPLDRC